MSQFLASGTVTVQGKVYNLRPYSAVNKERLDRQGAKLAAQLEAMEITEFEYYDRVLRLVIADEPGWDCKADDFDGREAENALLSFVPPSRQLYLLLTGFQPV